MKKTLILLFVLTNFSISIAAGRGIEWYFNYDNRLSWELASQFCNNNCKESINNSNCSLSYGDQVFTCTWDIDDSDQDESSNSNDGLADNTIYITPSINLLLSD